MKPDIKKPVRLRIPQEGEEELIFKVENYNEETGRCYISPLNSPLAMPGQELVSIDEITNVD